MLQKYLPSTHRPWSKKYTLGVIAFAFGLWLLYALISPGIDYYGAYTWMVTSPEKFIEVADYPWTLNPTWMVPFMAPFITLPGNAGLIAFMGAMIAMTVYGCYVFGGRPVLTLLSAQMWWVLWWGQLEGWGVLALVLGWFAIIRPSWFLMFLSLAIGSFKPQVGFIPLIALWWWTGKERWKSLAAMLVLLGLSIWIWGPWPLWYLEGITKFVGDNHFGGWNSSIGPIALPLFLPAILLRLPREKRLLALTATTLIVSPYLPYYSTILVLCFSVPWWVYIFAFTGYIPAFFENFYLPWNSLWLLPLGVLAWIYWPYFKPWAQHMLQKFQKKENGT
ncbi:MAG: hypothetical protein CVU39_11605 [Chloroflexi bacterium HGW-Chloroflexi-10]|nr:MAG: hypothetical protein CVU39_11605 [Chloroflexi bacterium HGW-Chloroflexi-10]